MSDVPVPPNNSKLDAALTWISAIPVAIVMTITFADVFGRYVFASPIRGGVEIIEYAMALLIFTSLPLVTRRRGHITVSLIDGLLKGVGRRIQRVLCDAISAIALGLLTWRLYLQGIEEMKSNAASVVLTLPSAPLSFTMAALAGLSTLLMLALIWDTFRNTGESK